MNTPRLVFLSLLITLYAPDLKAELFLSAGLKFSLTKMSSSGDFLARDTYFTSAEGIAAFKKSIFLLGGRAQYNSITQVYGASSFSGTSLSGASTEFGIVAGLTFSSLKVLAIYDLSSTYMLSSKTASGSEVTYSKPEIYGLSMRFQPPLMHWWIGLEYSRAKYNQKKIAGTAQSGFLGMSYRAIGASLGLAW